jgi:hypothetical protein
MLMAGATIEGLKFTKPQNRKACAVALDDSIVARFDFLKGEKSCPLLPLLIVPGTRSFLIITGALRIILKSLFRSMRSGTRGSMDFSVPTYRRSFIGIWTAATSTAALPALINAGYEW